MVQAHAHELLNQKDASLREGASTRPIIRATERLAAALERLEFNLEFAMLQQQEQQRATPDVNQLGLFAQENEMLRQERENLNSAISQLQNQYDDLHNVASTIYGKLNDSIRKLTHIIED